MGALGLLHLTMKDFIISLLILSVLVAAFSTIETPVERFTPKEGWAFFGGEESPVPFEDGTARNTFSFGEADGGVQEIPQEGATETQSIISVEVVTEEQETKDQSNIIQILQAIAYPLAALDAVGLIVIFVMWRKSKKQKPHFGGAFPIKG